MDSDADDDSVADSDSDASARIKFGYGGSGGCRWLVDCLRLHVVAFRGMLLPGKTEM